MTLARARVVVVLALAGCGGAPARPPLPPIAADAGPGEPARAPADAAPPDRCGGYDVAVRPVLGRVERAAEQFLAQLERAGDGRQVAAAADGLAAAIDGERPALEAIRTQDLELDAAHAQLTAALAQLAVAVRGLGRAYAAGGAQAQRDAAARELHLALRAWDEAAKRLLAICPELS